jgi:hypothetical protein
MSGIWNKGSYIGKRQGARSLANRWIRILDDCRANLSSQENDKYELLSLLRQSFLESSQQLQLQIAVEEKQYFDDIKEVIKIKKGKKQNVINE